MSDLYVHTPSLKMSTSKRIFQSVTDCWRFEDRQRNRDIQREREDVALFPFHHPLCASVSSNPERQMCAKRIGGRKEEGESRNAAASSRAVSLSPFHSLLRPSRRQHYGLIFPLRLQGWARKWAPGCDDLSGKLRQMWEATA